MASGHELGPFFGGCVQKVRKKEHTFGVLDMANFEFFLNSHLIIL
jgi:hypothetical protein